MKRYVWFSASGICLLVDMKDESVIGSIIPQVNGDCIIRYGHHPKTEPMLEDVVKAQNSDQQTIIKAAGTICGRLQIDQRAGEDSRALMRFAAEGGVYRA